MATLFPTTPSATHRPCDRAVQQMPGPPATALHRAPLPVENLFPALLENEVTDKSADTVIGNQM